MRELQRRRQTSAVFAGKDGFITARDLLRCVAPLLGLGSAPPLLCSGAAVSRMMNNTDDESERLCGPFIHTLHSL